MKNISVNKTIKSGFILLTLLGAKQSYSQLSITHKSELKSDSEKEQKEPHLEVYGTVTHASMAKANARETGLSVTLYDVTVLEFNKPPKYSYVRSLVLHDLSKAQFDLLNLALVNKKGIRLSCKNLEQNIDPEFGTDNSITLSSAKINSSCVLGLSNDAPVTSKEMKEEEKQVMDSHEIKSEPHSSH